MATPSIQINRATKAGGVITQIAVDVRGAVLFEISTDQQDVTAGGEAEGNAKYSFAPAFEA